MPLTGVCYQSTTVCVAFDDQSIIPLCLLHLKDFLKVKLGLWYSCIGVWSCHCNSSINTAICCSDLEHFVTVYECWLADLVGTFATGNINHIFADFVTSCQQFTNTLDQYDSLLIIMSHVAKYTHLYHTLYRPSVTYRRSW